MLLDRRHFLICSAALAASPAHAFQSDYSLKGRARFRGLGAVEGDWLFDDPFERSLPGAEPVPVAQFTFRNGVSRTAKVLDLIGFAEAGRLQYDAVHVSAKRRPKARPTRLTLAEIKHWIRSTPGQHHAIGRYQFIPSTLVGLTRRAQVPHHTRFTPDLQDNLAVLLLRDAGYDDFLAGRLSMSRFMDNMAKIWAGLPKHNGKSHYHGYAGNRATISRSFYTQRMQEIFA